jgi:putative ABC transport system permease protein
MKLAGIMWKNALRNRRRTVLTVLSITVSIFLVSTLEAVVDTLYRPSNGSSTPHLRVVVHRSTSITQSLPESYRQRLQTVPGVKYLVGLTWFGGQYIDERNFFANFASDTENFEKVFDEYAIPPDQLAAWKSERTAALVGKKLMEKFNWQVGQRITLKGTIYPISPEFTIRAVYTTPDETGEDAFYFHYDYFDEALGRLGQIGSFTIKADSAESVPRIIDAVDGMFRNTAAETKTETEQAFALGFVSMLGNVKLLLTAISAAVVFTILLVAGNNMAMSIRERTGEVAILKTLGFRRNTILILLVGESLVIAVLGGLLGALGAKLAYAFIGITFNKAKFLGFGYAVGAGLLGGYGVWLLFAGSSAVRGWVKTTRYVCTVGGFLVGFGAGIVFYMGVGNIMSQGGFFSSFAVSIPTLFACMGIAAVVGVSSALVPALRASRIGIADALRYVG